MSSSIETAIAATIKEMFARGELSLELPDANIVDAVLRAHPHIGTNPAEAIKAIADTAGKRLDNLQHSIEAKLKDAGSKVDEAKVNAMIDGFFQKCYAENVKKEATAKSGKKPLPELVEVDPLFVHNGVCDQIELMVNTQRHVMLSGPSGSCKTFPVEQVLRKMGRRYLKISICEGMNQNHFIAAPKVSNENGVSVTSYEDGFVTYCVRNNIVCVLDEVDNTQMENLACLRAVSETGVLLVPQTGERLVAGDEFLLIMTCNSLRDSTGNYSGYRLDNAITNRMRFIKCDYLSAPEEIAILERTGLSAPAAKGLVHTFKGLRAAYQAGKINQAPSTRIAVEVSMMMQGKDKHGKKVTKPLQLAEAMAFCLLNSLPDAEYNEAVAVLKQGL